MIRFFTLSLIINFWAVNAQPLDYSLWTEILQKYDMEGSPYYSTSRLWDDGIIDPVDTRKILAMGIAASLNQKIPDMKNGVFRM